MPANSFPPADDRATTSPAGAVAAARHVAWVDDEEALVFLARRMLEKLGFRVTTFQTGAEAVAALRAEPDSFDLLVTDQGMPGMSGIEVAREIRRFDGRIPLVLVSGLVTPGLEAEAGLAGVDQVLEKPASMGALCRAVEGVLDRPPRA